jgi:hypothetical protein
MKISQWPKADLQWYLGVRCKKCKAPILFALDRTEGTGEGAPMSAGKLVLTCASEKCKHQADYSAAAVSRFQKQPEKPNETRKMNEGNNNKGRKPKR